MGAVRDWGRVLSLGEQQRIGFARLLLSKPDYVFLDEATSAVDFPTETRLYQLLAGMGASFVSVGHRVSILDYHTHVLTLHPGGSWKLAELREGDDEEARRLLAKV
jgi:putative ATP-binding cassette transporter